MDEYRFRLRNRQHASLPHANSPEGIQLLVRSEERILQAISAGAPIPGVLDKICDALDYQIGNVISRISLPERNSVATARNARHFGLFIFLSADIVTADDNVLGSLEMYCCVPCRPTFEEFLMIERAKCLAAIAIERYNEAGHRDDGRVPRRRPVTSCALERRSFIN